MITALIGAVIGIVLGLALAMLLAARLEEITFAVLSSQLVVFAVVAVLVGIFAAILARPPSGEAEPAGGAPVRVADVARRCNIGATAPGTVRSSPTS